MRRILQQVGLSKITVGSEGGPLLPANIYSTGITKYLLHSFALAWNGVMKLLPKYRKCDVESIYLWNWPERCKVIGQDHR
ncbi:MAG: hypothetical protein A2167_00335 [Planctomycetes bacterium RBG_13_46_10]|nr:MAG: hypothetical protein A2167_00335 [Planctomycetes bacterium RBG_13_46_10]